MGIIAVLGGIALGIIVGMLLVVLTRNSHRAWQYRHTHGFNAQQKAEMNELKADRELLEHSRRDYSEENYRR